MAIETTGSDNILNLLKSMGDLRGVSATNMNQVQGGALQNIINQLAPRRKPIDPALITLIASADIAQKASQPGATAVGAISSGVVTGAKQYLADKEAQEKRDMTRATLGLQLFDKFGKTSASKEYIAQEPVTINGIQFKKGDNLFLTQRQFSALQPDEQNKLTTQIPKTTDIKIIDDPFGNKIYKDGPNAGKRVFDNNNNFIDYGLNAQSKNDDVSTVTISETDTKPVVELNKIQKDNLMKLSKEYLKSKEVKDFQELEQTFNKVLVSYDQAYTLDEPKVADLSMIFAYMKMLDPRSVVREGEQQQAQSTSSMFNYLANVYNSLLGEGRLTDTQRKSFRDGAYAYYDKQIGLLNDKNTKEKLFSKAFGINPNLYLIEPKTYDVTGYNVRIPRNINYDLYIEKEDKDDIGTLKPIPDDVDDKLKNFVNNLSISQLQFMLRAKNVKSNPVILFAIERRIDELSDNR